MDYFPQPFLAPGLRNVWAGWLNRRRHRQESVVQDSTDFHNNPWVTQRGTMVTSGNHIEPLIDGEVAFASAVESIERAERDVHLLQMLLDREFVPSFASGRNPTMVALLRDASARGVRVRLLLSKVEPVDVLGFEAAAACFEGAPGVQVLPFPLRMQLQHAKMLIVDGREAFLFGSLFDQAYWDQPTHAITDPRRNGGSPGIGSRPIHDVSVRMRGPVVADVDGTFVSLWNHRCDRENRTSNRLLGPERPQAVGRQSVQLVRTLPGRLLEDRPEGERDVYESYLRGLRHARHYVYAENQYLTSGSLCDAILQALERAPTLQVILLLNSSIDIPSYARHQTKQVKRLMANPRVGIFSLWHSEAGPSRVTVQRGYAHSKATVIDDGWASLGTANMDGFSLHGAAEFGLPSSRNIETNLVVLDGIAGQPSTGLVAALRRRLWSEHLGQPEAGVEASGPNGFLELWGRVAQENVNALNGGRAPQSPILPWAPAGGRRGNQRALEAVGVRLDRINLEK